MPRPYKALQKQGYKHYFTALTGRTRIADIAIIHSKTSLSVIAGEACLAPTAGILLRRAMARLYNRNAI